ncbi:MAG: hypothetical protein JWM19_2025 [Actinomycetia bacterium]|nr:hypothetical protein [Actinomycetes bacterium]
MTRQDEITRTADLLKDALGAAADVMTGIGVTPRAGHLLPTALREGQYPERPVPSRLRRSRLARVRPGWRPGWRLGVAVSVAAALVAGIVVAVQPAAPTVLTAQLLADHASAAALAQPTVSPGQWVYRRIEMRSLDAPKGMPATHILNSWITADDSTYYGQISAGNGTATYESLPSLPRDPAALDAYLERKAGANAPAQVKTNEAFRSIDYMLEFLVPSPALEAELYQALAVLPGLQVDSHVTAIDGQAGVAFVLPENGWSVEQEIILNPSTYAYLGDASHDLAQGGAGMEFAVLRREFVAGPGSTQPSLTPPTAVELLAEQADAAVSDGWTQNDQPLIVVAGSWILRKLATSSGDQTVWATADDSEQASYVNGTLQVCSRTAACAKSTQWLMPVGPSYTTINSPYSAKDQHPESLPMSLPQLLATLNSYSTGCTDIAGDCNAVNAIANMDTGYVNRPIMQGSWYLLLAEIPGVTAEHITDVAGQADLALRFPFTDGVTEILFNASTYRLIGYVRNGTETVITKIAEVTGPGSLTPACTPDTPGCTTK